MANLTRKERFARGFGGKLNKIRTSQGLSLIELYEKCSVDIGNISKIERGVIVPRLDTAVRLARGLGVKLDSLVE